MANLSEDLKAENIGILVIKNIFMLARGGAPFLSKRRSTIIVPTMLNVSRFLFLNSKRLPAIIIEGIIVKRINRL